MILQATNEPDQSEDAIASHREKNPPPVYKPLHTINEMGARIWERLHAEPTAANVEWMESQLRLFGCQCDGFYQDWKAKHPFPLAGTEWEKFVWTVDLHNSVNLKLRRAEWSYVEAWKKWRVNRCDQCGLCCVEVQVEFLEWDRCKHPALPILKPAGEACPMQRDNSCSCHDNKPDICKRFVAGGFWCNELRRKAGLGPL
jgi:hypothetical protein